MADEYGGLYGPGLAALGCHHTQVVAVRTRHRADTLWVLEEALRSGAVGAVVAHVDTVELTPARRLALAAQEGGTPCLIVSGASAPEIPATATRWRVGPAPAAHGGGFASSSRPPPIAMARVALERCRRPVAADTLLPEILEWSDETLSFSVVSRLADGAPRARTRRAG